jgi:uncharacterized protein
MEVGINSGTAVMPRLVDRVPWREVILFCALAYGVSWVWWAPMVLPHLGAVLLGGRLPDLAHNPAVARLGLGMFGPLLAALVMRLAVSREGIKGTLGVWRSWRNYLVAFSAPALFIAVLILIDHLSGLGRFVWSRPIPIWIAYPAVVFLNSLLGNPLTFGEEYGWRGYLLPRLFPPGEIKATLLLGQIWGGWHVPAILMGLNYPKQPLWAAALLVFALNILLLAFPFTWLYIASRGSPFVTAVFHASLNAAGDTFTTLAHIPNGNPLIVGGGGLITAALMLVIVAFWYRRFKQSTTAAIIADLWEPKRKGDRLDWLR